MVVPQNKLPSVDLDNANGKNRVLKSPSRNRQRLLFFKHRHNTRYTFTGRKKILTWRASRWELFFKHLFDRVIALFFLVLLSPLIAGLMILIRVDSAGPSVYKSLRMGKKRRFFYMYKFRTMLNNANQQLGFNPAVKEKFRENFKLKNDHRITGIGLFLRRSALDELLQLVNVLKGDMSLVGPRPILPEEELKVANERFDVLPGITGLWQICGKNALSYARKNELDRYYVCHHTLWLDLKIAVATLPAIIRGIGFRENKGEVKR